MEIEDEDILANLEEIEDRLKRIETIIWGDPKLGLDPWLPRVNQILTSMERFRWLAGIAGVTSVASVISLILALIALIAVISP